jgi:hypothetical protein
MKKTIKNLNKKIYLYKMMQIKLMVSKNHQKLIMHKITLSHKIIKIFKVPPIVIFRMLQQKLKKMHHMPQK